MDVADFTDVRPIGFVSAAYSSGDCIFITLAAIKAKHMIGMPCHEYCNICHALNSKIDTTNLQITKS